MMSESENAELDPRLHFVVATAIVVKDGKVLIIKRAPHEKAYPNKWTVPGGKLVTSEYKDRPKTTDDAWYGIMEWLVKKEVQEETGLEIDKPRYLDDLVFIRPDGFPVFTISYWAHWVSGEVLLSKDFTAAAWVGPDELGAYDLIEGIDEEIRAVFKLL